VQRSWFNWRPSYGGIALALMRPSVGKAAIDLLAALPYFGIHGCAGSKCLLARFDDMRVASLTSLILLATVSAPLAAPYRIDSRHHQEGRPDAATLVPPDWRLQRDEQRYVSPDGSSWFAPHASSVGSEPIARHMDRIARQEGETVTYFRREPDWIAVSGFKAGRIFYRKAVLACGGKVWHHIEFEYPDYSIQEMICKNLGFPPYPDCPIPLSFYPLVNIALMWFGARASSL
jgi:hypothetical protein